MRASAGTVNRSSHDRKKSGEETADDAHQCGCGHDRNDGRQNQCHQRQRETGGELPGTFFERQNQGRPRFGGNVVERLRQMDVNTLTPREALNTLYELKKLLT